MENETGKLAQEPTANEIIKNNSNNTKEEKEDKKNNGKEHSTNRIDYQYILDLVPYSSKVLDLGCGSGDLLLLLEKKKKTQGHGIEISLQKSKKAVAKGVSVIHDDLEEAIKNYATQTFDICILSQTLQELRHPECILQEMVRVGKEAIVAMYNLARWPYRFQIFFRGHFPKSRDLPYDWLTTNIALLSVKDFRTFCKYHGIKIIEEIILTHGKRIKHLANLRGQLCIFKLKTRQRKKK